MKKFAAAGNVQLAWTNRPDGSRRIFVQSNEIWE